MYSLSEKVDVSRGRKVAACARRSSGILFPPCSAGDLPQGESRIVLGVLDVVAGDRDGVGALGQLQLPDEVAAPAERHLADAEVELPHPAEPFVVERRDLVPGAEEPFAPGL